MIATTASETDALLPRAVLFNVELVGDFNEAFARPFFRDRLSTVINVESGMVILVKRMSLSKVSYAGACTTGLWIGTEIT